MVVRLCCGNQVVWEVQCVTVAVWQLCFRGLRCVEVAVCGSCRVGEIHCAGVANGLALQCVEALVCRKYWLQYVRVPACKTCSV